LPLVQGQQYGLQSAAELHAVPTGSWPTSIVGCAGQAPAVVISEARPSGEIPLQEG
jgi:hypothetical protein